MLKTTFMLLLLVASSPLAAQTKNIDASLNLAPLKACLDKVSLNKQSKGASDSQKRQVQECAKQFSATLTPKQKNCAVQVRKDCKQSPSPCVDKLGAPNRPFIAAKMIRCLKS